MNYTTYDNQPSRKTMLSAAMAEHRRMDRLSQGATGGNRRGCSVACAGHSICGDWGRAYNHEMVATHVGLPVWAARLIDRIFEGLPAQEAGQFSQDWIDALPIGADASRLWMHVATMIVSEANAALTAIDRTQARTSDLSHVDAVSAANGDFLALLDRAIDGEAIHRSLWTAGYEKISNARRAAWAAGDAGAAWAAGDAGDAWAAGAAWAAVDAGDAWAAVDAGAAGDAGAAWAAVAAGAAWATGAAWAAVAAGAAWAAGAARHAYFRRIAEGFIALLKALPIPA